MLIALVHIVGRLVLARSITSASSADRHIDTRGASRTRDEDEGHDADTNRGNGHIRLMHEAMMEAEQTIAIRNDYHQH